MWHGHILHVKWCQKLHLPLSLPSSVWNCRHTFLGFGVVFHLLGGLWDYSPVMPPDGGAGAYPGLTLQSWAVPSVWRARHWTSSLTGPFTTSPGAHAAYLSQPHFAFCLLSQPKCDHAQLWPGSDVCLLAWWRACLHSKVTYPDLTSEQTQRMMSTGCLTAVGLWRQRT